MDVFRGAVAEFGCVIKLTGKTEWAIVKESGIKGAASPAKEFLKSNGLVGIKAIDKKIPECIFYRD